MKKAIQNNKKKEKITKSNFFFRPTATVSKPEEATPPEATPPKPSAEARTPVQATPPGPAAAPAPPGSTPGRRKLYRTRPRPLHSM